MSAYRSAVHEHDARMLIVSPCRDEVAFVRRTIDSVVAQSYRPTLWVIVDDGSTDGTSQVLADAAASHEWISVVTVGERDKRDVGPAVVKAFCAGLAIARLDEFDYVCKLDVDLILPVEYLQRCLDEFDADPRLGTFSGKVFYRDANGTVVSEGIGDDISVGAMKMYRVAAFRQIGGLVPLVMWDGIDCQRLRMTGWRARSAAGEKLWVEHLRPMGSSDAGVVKGRIRWGWGQYSMGTGVLWILASSAFRMLKRPFVIGGLAIAVGYLGAVLDRAPRLEDPPFRAYLRRYHRLSLLHGKPRAVELLEAEGAARWTPEAPARWDGPCVRAARPEAR